MKKIENWFVWLVADSLYIYLYVTRGLNLMAILFAVYLVMAVAGLIEWTKSQRRIEEPELEPPVPPGPAEVA